MSFANKFGSEHDYVAESISRAREVWVVARLDVRFGSEADLIGGVDFVR